MMHQDADTIWESLQRGESHRQFFKRPLVTLAYAQSIDGSIAPESREKLQLSCPESLRLTHRLRAANDAILLGIETVLREDPRLTVRHVPGENPVPVILDTHLRISPEARVFSPAGKSVILAVGDHVDTKAFDKFTGPGVKILPVTCNPSGLLDLNQLLSMLADMEINSLMVEGGVTVLSSFMNLRLVDWLVITVAPFIVGGISAYTGMSAGISDCLKLKNCSWEKTGNDFILWARPDWSRGHKKSRI